jgi:excisionase family DNA binding protein
MVERIQGDHGTTYGTMPFGDQRVLVTVEEAARILSIGRTTMYSMVLRKDVPFPSIKIGRSRRIPVKALYDIAEQV